MLFKEADNGITSLDLKAEIRETLVYEYRYKSLIERAYNNLENQYLEFIGAWYHELLGSIRECSLTSDRKFFESLDLPFEQKKILFAQLIIYRFDQNISIMDDLHFEKTKDYLAQCQQNIKEYNYAKTKNPRERIKDAKVLKKSFYTKLE